MQISDPAEVAIREARCYGIMAYTSQGNIQVMAPKLTLLEKSSQFACTFTVRLKCLSFLEAKREQTRA